MRAIVNEPTVEYKTSQWVVAKPHIDKLRMLTYTENGVSFYNQPIVRYDIQDKKPKQIKISSLRGKFSKQTKQEIDKQLSELRKEWDRDF